MWVSCSVATLFVASRFRIRMSTKGRLMINDYFLVAALPLLLTASGLIQSSFDVLYRVETFDKVSITTTLTSKEASRLVAAIEFLWAAIYCVKFCFLAQFKFYKPPYAYVVIHLTRYYWTSIGICVAAFVFTIIQPIVICFRADNCRHFDLSNTVSWEMAASSIDIVTDLFVISIPLLLIYMAIYSKMRTIINATFKSLSVLTIAIAATRMATQYNISEQRVDYVAMTFWLMVESATALIVASVSSYRVIMIDYLAERARQNQNRWFRSPQRHPETPANPPEDSISELLILVR
ncbi:hypothetical protein B0J11DRAFT_502156 [Dendryphion nanum]|uniref:Rhodopsin domain-containing protein n=1 Tax=Dendryphion nanum TaxID=256645 RepID=A0A9P9EBI5_9PLEO|nr:hypothetical protein B0J11DRAFT_502156 [Dendryphion nanum]